jgi:hypothetical protein
VGLLAHRRVAAVLVGERLLRDVDVLLAQAGALGLSA